MSLLFAFHLIFAEVPTAPFLDLTVLSDSSVYANFSAPISDGGSAINSYKVILAVVAFTSVQSLILRNLS